MNSFIPVNEPVISRQARKNVLHALDTGWLSSAGPFVKEFETKFAKYLGIKHAIAVANGTAALHVALLALGIGKGDEVIVPAFTMASSWMAIIYTGAKPVFVDCESDTYNIDPKRISAKITSRTKAIMPVHIYGHPADTEAILTIAAKHKLFVIEDAAEAHGAKYKGKKCGTFGHINCFSFYANKIVTTGEGGMVVTDDDRLAGQARKYMDLYHSDQKRFIHEKLGFNYRLTNLQAAIGVGELANIEKYIAKKRRMAQMYRKNLSRIPGLILPVTRPGVRNVYWMYGIRVEPVKFGMDKDTLRRRLKDQGVDTRDFFYSPADQPALKSLNLKVSDYPVTELITRTGFYLPSGLAITDSQISRVCRIIKNIHDSNRKN